MLNALSQLNASTVFAVSIIVVCALSLTVYEFLRGKDEEAIE